MAGDAPAAAVAGIHVDVIGAPGCAIDTAELSRLAQQVLAAEGISAPAEMCLSFVDEAEMARLNGLYRGKEGPTDVLSFSIDGAGSGSGSGEGAGALDDPGAGAAGDPDGVPLLVGDVVVCPEVAARNAAEHSTTFEAEIALLVVHGVLHLLGMDHEDPVEAEAMEAREARHVGEHFRSTARPGQVGAP